jgi:type IV/VI secretion system ImpK/VasF family protein
VSETPFENLLALAEPLLVSIRVIAQPDVRPEAARALLDEQFRSLKSAAQRARVAAKDTDDVVYALAAHADEVMLARPATREAWLPRLVQLALFGENTAGDGFFTRLDAIRRDPSRGNVLLVYYVVLSLGFRGRYAGRDAARLELVENVHLDLLRAGADTDVALAPNALPARRRRGELVDPRWALAAGVSVGVLAIGAWLAFALDLWAHAGRALGG